MLAALIATCGMFVALYLMLYKLGYIGSLSCAVGSCEAVQTSRWATLLGFPVATWGVVYYVAILSTTLAGLSPALSNNSTLARALAMATLAGVVFSLWLTYLELFVIHAICMWCVISALVATALFVVCWLDLLDQRHMSTFSQEDAEEIGAEAGARLRGAGWGSRIRNTEEITIHATAPSDD